jgi:DNA-binding response OmpR family regulator
VDNAILRLRRKLDELAEAIETVWGVGYRLRREP